MATALVTGASSGIGRTFCEQLAARGQDLVVVARTVDRLERLKTQLEGRHGVRVEVITADLGDRAQMQRVADRLADGTRPVDLLVNNAGYGLKRPFLTNTIDDEEQMLAVLVQAVMVLSHAAATAMRERGHGAIVNVSSVAGFMVTGTYSAAKSWVTVFSESLATQLRGTGVTVTALCPGFTRTEFHDRADIDHGELPGFMWLDAQALVREALADVDRGKVVSVPSPQYKVISAALRSMPRPLLRQGRLARIHRPQK